MTGLDPPGTGSPATEIQTTVSADTAVVCTGAFKGRLRRPGKGALVDRKVRERFNDLIHGMRRIRKGISMVSIHWPDTQNPEMRSPDDKVS
jgi:hypothetical protein